MCSRLNCAGQREVGKLYYPSEFKMNRYRELWNLFLVLMLIAVLGWQGGFAAVGGPDPRLDRVVHPGKTIKIPDDPADSGSNLPPPGITNSLNIALNKPARQSSISQWSTGPNDASGGNDGKKSDGVGWGFHTDKEDNPWWQVDLEKQYWIGEIRLYNRRDLPERARTIQVLLSKDGLNWKTVYSHNGTGWGADGKPLLVYPKTGPEGFRYVRVQLKENEFLHLDEVEVYELNALFNRPGGGGTTPPTMPTGGDNGDICNDPRTKAFLGAWCALGDAKTRCTIECVGSQLRFTNEVGEHPTGRFETATAQTLLTTDAFGDAVKVTIADGGKRLNWSNGVFWARCPEVVPPVINPPVINPPVIPPVVNPPVINPPVINPPIVKPRVEPKINEVLHTARGVLHAGDILRVVVRGTPRMKATFELPPIIKRTQMREGKAGEYSAAYAVKPEDRVQGGGVVGYLTAPDGEEDFLMAREKLTIGDSGEASPIAGGVPTLRLEKNSFTPGEEIRVSFTAPAGYSPNAWIGIVPSNVPHGSEEVNDQHDVTYQYLKQRTQGTLTFKAPLAPWGSYDLRFNDGGGKEVGSVTFTTGVLGMIPGAGPRLHLDKGNFAPGEDVLVHFTAPATYAADAWAGFIPSNIPHGEEAVNDAHDVTYNFLNRQTAGTFILKAPQQAGAWDCRMNDTDAGGKEVASVSFTVGGSGGNAPIDSATNPPVPPPNNNTQGGRYTLSRIEVSRVYTPPQWLPPIAYQSGKQNYRADQRTFPLGWDFRWPESKVNLNRSMSTVTLTTVPTTVAPGANATFAATMEGDWNSTGYADGRRYLIRLEGAAGDKEWALSLEPPIGPHQGRFDTTHTSMVPQSVDNQIVIPIKAMIRFGIDHTGDMEMRFIYEAAR